MVVVCGVAMMGGCALSGGGAFDGTPEMVAAGAYGETFDAAKDVLRAYRFELERVDAREGVITTKASAASGWVTPWKDYASDSDGAWRDTVQDEARVARVVFARRDGAAQSEVGVVVERVRVTRFGRRVDPTSPKRFKRVASDPTRSGVDVEVVGRDGALEARIRADILDLVAQMSH